MKRPGPVLSLLLALALTAALAPNLGGRALGADYVAANHTQSNGQPYYIMVNRAGNTVTVYGLDEAGYYTVPVKAMVCSVGRAGRRTPLGTFALTGTKKEWCLMLDGTYGQYSNQFSGYYLFHSVCYTRADPAAMITEEYNRLGEAASMGCVRLQVGDAKWLYDNCGAGTKVTVYDGKEPGPLGKPETLVGQIGGERANGWDPTDPRAENPWKPLLASGLALDTDQVSLEAGMRQRLWPALTPEGALYPRVTWTVEDPAVASVDGVGRVTGLSQGETQVTARCGELETVCAVTVTGELLPFDDLRPGTWYYSDMRYAYEKGIFTGDGRGSIDPEGNMTRAAMAQVLYNMAGRPRTELQGEDWSAAALGWAVGMGILEQSEADPEGAFTRQEFVNMLYRFQLSRWSWAGENTDDLSGFSDGGSLTGFDRTAMGWAVGNGLLQGDSKNRLDPAGVVPRAQAAAILRRYQGRFDT